MAENETPDTQNVEIFKLPDHYSMSGSFRFGFARHDEKFNQIVARIDVFIGELRATMIRKIATEMKLGVKWVD